MLGMGLEGGTGGGLGINRTALGDTGPVSTGGVAEDMPPAGGGVSIDRTPLGDKGAVGIAGIAERSVGRGAGAGMQDEGEEHTACLCLLTPVHPPAQLFWWPAHFPGSQVACQAPRASALQRCCLLMPGRRPSECTRSPCPGQVLQSPLVLCYMCAGTAEAGSGKLAPGEVSLCAGRVGQHMASPVTYDK